MLTQKKTSGNGTDRLYVYRLEHKMAYTFLYYVQHLRCWFWWNAKIYLCIFFNAEIYINSQIECHSKLGTCWKCRTSRFNRLMAALFRLKTRDWKHLHFIVAILHTYYQVYLTFIWYCFLHMWVRPTLYRVIYVLDISSPTTSYNFRSLATTEGPVASLWHHHCILHHPLRPLATHVLLCPFST